MYLRTEAPLLDVSILLERPMHVWGIVICVVLAAALNAMQMSLAFGAAKFTVGNLEIWILQNSITLLNYLPLRAGTAIRFVYLRRLHKIEFSRLAGIIAIRNVLLCLAAGAFGLLGLGLAEGVSSPWLWLIYLGMSGLMVAGYLCSRLDVSFGVSRLGKIFEIFMRGFGSLASHPILSLAIFVLIALQFSVLGGRLWLAFDAAGERVDLSTLLLLAPAATVLSIIAITPGNMGLREWIIGLLSAAMGNDLAFGMLAIALDRIVLILVTLALGLPSTWYVWKRIGLASSKSERTIK